MSTPHPATKPKLGSIALVAVASMLLSGCFLRSIVGFVNGDGQVTISANIEATRCEEDSFIGLFRCTITYTDDEGVERYVESEVVIAREFGLAGVLIDPLVLQIPDDASNLVAIYNNAGVDEPAVITETSSFDVTPSIAVQAEADMKFVIVELPDDVLATLSDVPMNFDFSIDFDVADPSALSVKPMLTGRVDLNGSSYYVPLFPCVTDFASVPSIVVPSGSTFGDIRPQVIDIAMAQPDLACDDVTYDFTDGAAATTTTTTATTTTAAPTTTVAASTTDETTTSTSVAPADGGVASTTSTVAPITVSLPETGSGSAVQIWMATVVLASGAAIVLVSRRRSTC